MKIKNVLISGVVCLLFAGCVAYSNYGDIKPVSPMPHSGSPNDPKEVDSLRPVFKWQSKSPGQSVDFAIWEAIRNESGPPNLYQYAKGEMVYFKQGITGQEVALEKDLAPNTTYFWSVKPAGTGNWATGNFHEVVFAPVATGSESATKLYFLFKTP